MYEFGGIQAKDPAIYSANQTSVGPTIPISLDTSGGDLSGKLWDTSTGEYLRTNVDLPGNTYWAYPDTFDQTQPSLGSNFTGFLFLREFRSFRINYKDLIMLNVVSS